MKFPTLSKLIGAKSSPFVEEARRTGLPLKVAKALDPAVQELFPKEPITILSTRDRFEQAALHSISDELRNLDLSYDSLNALAMAVETLGLARSGEVPDPFRRVWVENEEGKRIQGVVLTCTGIEVAVFSNSDDHAFAKSGSVIRLSYCEASSTIVYELQLNDLVRLPKTNIMHLGRRSGVGSIGRLTGRRHVEIMGFLNQEAVGEQGNKAMPCKILDISMGGVRLISAWRPKEWEPIHLNVFLDDGIEEPFSVDCVAHWSEPDPEGFQVGLQFNQLSQSQANRLQKALPLYSPA